MCKCQIAGDMIVCGGDVPWHLHGFTENGVTPNIYFYVTESGYPRVLTYTREVHTELPFSLTDEDWKEMHSHADGGCGSEKLCAKCGEPI